MTNSVAANAQRRAASALRQNRTIRASGVPRGAFSEESRRPGCEVEGKPNIFVQRILHILGIALIAFGVLAPHVLAALASVWPRTTTFGWIGGACLFGGWIPIAVGAAILRLLQR